MHFKYSEGIYVPQVLPLFVLNKHCLSVESAYIEQFFEEYSIMRNTFTVELQIAFV